LKIANPLNDVQTRFNQLCDYGGGKNGGPARTKVQELLHEGSKPLNALAVNDVREQLEEFSDADPWQVCFAIGLGWGHLAKVNSDFTRAAISVLSHLDEDALKDAKMHHLERGPLPIEQSLRGGYLMFQKVRLPTALPDSTLTLHRAQERWLQPILSRNSERPKYIGSWNSTAMFMIALFARPDVGATLVTPEVLLPPGGPIFKALQILHRANILSSPPHGNELDDEAFEPGSIYLNNASMAELLKGRQGCSMLDIHTGLYMLGTRYPMSSQWSA
jgi:hypothetical protein